jgi:FkbM family methyltransferase
VSDYWEPVVIGELLRDKYQLEADMRARQLDHSLRVQYFDVLNRISRSYLGSFFAVFPEIATPLLFQGASSDVWNMQQVFLDRQYDVGIPKPRKILDLGAYVGYTAVYFANRFPSASIISVEPPGSNFDTLVANTAAYSNIRCLPAAVWHERTELTLADCSYGDWGLSFTPRDADRPVETVPGYTITNILEMHGWNGVDLIKCSSHGGRVDTLLRPRPNWLERTATVITRPGGQGWQAGDAEKLAVALPEAEFQRRTHGPLVIFSRRSMEFRPLEPPANALHLIARTPQTRAFTLSNVKDRLGFYRFGYAGIQLTPNAPGLPPASLTMRLKLTGHSRFNATIETGKAPPSLVRFKVQIVDADTGGIALCAEHSLHENVTFDWDAGFAPACGLHDVILSTENIEAQQADESTRQTAHFIDPRLQ